MSAKKYGHTFVNHKSEEMICWGCGYVTPRVQDPVAWMAEQQGGSVLLCGGWHGSKKVPYSAKKLRGAKLAEAADRGLEED